jgi:hypothetical protein
VSGEGTVSGGSASGTGGAWAAVFLMVLGFSLVTVALPMESWVLGGIGAAIGVLGIVVGKLVNLMGQVH